MIGQTFSHYRILENLGEGGMGSVYVAEDTHLGRRVAIKFPAVTRDEHHYRARFLREARAVSMLNHANIATIYDYGETEAGQPFIVMELVKGPTLSDLLHEHGLSIKRAVEIIEAVAEALSEAHSKGIVHRDIKPTNVVINERDVPKVLDFGLAKQTSEEHVRSADPDARTLLATKTRSGAIVGTPLYLSPEQATGATVDARSDIFALGALLYECIAGRPAFDGESVIEIVAQVIHFDVPPPSKFNPSIPPELDRIALKALQKRPEARYQSAAELIDGLRAVKAQLQGGSPTATQRIQRAPGTFGSSALTTLSEKLWQPRLSLLALLAVVSVIMLAFLVVPRLWRSKPHQLAPEARQYFEEGTNALREGTYYKANRALQRAISIDDKYALAHARLAESWTELDYSDKAKDEIIKAGLLAPDRSVLPPMEALYLSALTDTVSRNFAGAISSYEEIVRQAPETEKAYAYVDLGRACEKNEEIDRAIQSYIEATNRAPQYATAFLRVGVLYGRKQNLAGATATFDKAESLYKDLSNYEGLTEVFYQRGALLNSLGRLTEAREQLEKALNITRTTNNKYQQINTLLELSRVAYSGGQTEQAKQYATEAVNLARADDLENLTTQGLLDLGYAFFVRRDYEQAETYFKQALDFAQRYKGQRNEARSKLWLGSLYIQQERTDEGLPLVESALGFFRNGGYRKEISRALLIEGRARLLKGEYEAGLKIFDEQLKLAKEVDDPSQVARSQNEIGLALSWQELYPQALRRYEESYTIGKSLENPLFAGFSLVNRADLLARLGRYEDARKALEQLAVITERLDDKNNYRRVWSIYTYWINARMEQSEGRFAEASANCQKALSLADTAEYNSARVELKTTLCMTKTLSGSASEGKKQCEEALTIADKTGDQRLKAAALLSLAESRLGSGDAAGALTTAQQAQEILARLHQMESEWRAWLIAARASRPTGDSAGTRERIERAASLLAKLRETWGAESFNTYLARPDINLYHKQLTELQSAAL